MDKDQVRNVILSEMTEKTDFRCSDARGGRKAYIFRLQGEMTNGSPPNLQKEITGDFITHKVPVVQGKDQIGIAELYITPEVHGGKNSPLRCDDRRSGGRCKCAHGARGVPRIENPY